jgi:hypothetical protein
LGVTLEEVVAAGKTRRSRPRKPNGGEQAADAVVWARRKREAMGVGDGDVSRALFCSGWIVREDLVTLSRGSCLDHVAARQRAPSMLRRLHVFPPPLLLACSLLAVADRNPLCGQAHRASVQTDDGHYSTLVAIGNTTSKRAGVSCRLPRRPSRMPRGRGLGWGMVASPGYHSGPGNISAELISVHQLVRPRHQGPLGGWTDSAPAPTSREACLGPHNQEPCHAPQVV